MKKSFKKVLLLSLALFALVACGTKTTDTPKEDEAFTVTVWTHPYVGADLKPELEKVYADMTAQFVEKHPKATVVFEEIPWANREQKITTTLAGGAGPDIFYLIPDQLTQFADQGIITPINDVLPDMDLSDFSETSISAVTYQGKLYGLPMLREAQTFFYNKEILDELGLDSTNLPKTWEEFTAWGEKAVAAGYYARNYEGGNTLNSTLYPLIWQAGGEIVDDKNNIQINEAKAVKAFEFINDYYQRGFIAKDSITESNHTPLFLEGKIMASWGAGAHLQMLREGKQFEYVIGEPLKDEVQATFGTTGTFVISNISKNKEMAAELLSLMTDTDNMRAFNKVTNYIPPRESATDLFKDDAELQQIAKYAEIARPGVINAKARVFMPDIQAKVQAMFEGTLTPQQAADESAEIIKNSFDK